ncbi:MAG: hypothetical protein WC091_25990 [Sulfuricellaceae bacterium]
MCAIKDGISYATLPSPGKARPIQVAAVVHGVAYPVLEKSGNWVRIRVRDIPSWAEKTLFAGSAACPTKTKLETTRTRAVNTRLVSKPSHATQQKQIHSASTVSSCACGSGRVCVGSRGGRYCITSGGKKRYGV